MDEVVEARLVRESCRGCRESFGELLEHYQKTVFNVAYRILGNHEDAKDVTQVVFLKAFEHLKEFDSKYRFFSWIYRIALNEAINFRKSRKRLETVEESMAKEHRTPENLLCETELSRVIQTALMSVGMEHRIVIVLRHFNDCSYRDIGEILDISEKTVKSRLFTARNLLKDVLSRKGIL